MLLWETGRGRAPGSVSVRGVALPAARLSLVRGGRGISKPFGQVSGVRSFGADPGCRCLLWDGLYQTPEGATCLHRGPSWGPFYGGFTGGGKKKIDNQNNT